MSADVYIEFAHRMLPSLITLAAILAVASCILSYMDDSE
jgi:heme A synthase